MPLFNSIGDPMPPRQLTDRDIWISNLKFPDQEDYIFHLSPTEFRQWIYGLNPRDALLLTSTHGISSHIKRQLSWKRFSIVTDWMWRMFH